MEYNNYYGYGEKRRKRGGWIGVVVILVIIVGALAFVAKRGGIDIPDIATNSTGTTLRELPVFSQGLSAVGVRADTIGFHSFSPDGKYFLFNAFTDGADMANQGYVVKLSDGAVTKLIGMPERGFDDSRVLQLYSREGTVLHFLSTGESKTYDLGDNVFFGSLSPDGRTYLVNTTEGLKKVDVKSGEVASFTQRTYDGAYAWFSDSKRILGFKQTDERLTDGAGAARIVGTWDIATGSFTPLAQPIPSKTFRNVNWIIPDKVARINAGFDDGSHDYLLDVASGEVVDLGDTSGSLMGGVAIDAKLGLLALVGGDDLSAAGSRVLVYKGIEKVGEATLALGYFRERVYIADQGTLVYLRKKYSDSGLTAQEVVKLDVMTGTEEVLQALSPTGYAALSLSADRRTWVASQGNLFIVGDVK